MMKNTLFQQALVVGICFLLLLISFSGCIEETPLEEPEEKEIPTVESNIIYVDDSGEQNYTSIQDALDHASDGCTIFVYNGTYYETLVINKSVNLVGASQDKTIIIYKENETVDIVSINADNCTITGFKIIKTTGLSDAIGINIKSSNNTISNNTILNTSKGIRLSSLSSDICSSNNTISNNTILNTSQGIFISGASKNTNVYGNNISNNQYGIKVDFSYDNNISNNTISLNSLYGVYLEPRSNDNIISWNVISNNNYSIRIIDSRHNEIFGNTIINNQRGMYFCCAARNNTVYYNIFTQNSEWNVRDLTSNQWDNGSIGNYWDDYNGTDIDGDGIGDIPYNISGGSNQDRYPLMDLDLQ